MDFSKLSAYLDTFYTEKGIPGVGCAVYYKHKPVYEHYAGYSDVENRVRFAADSIFKLYSASKLITCTAALQLMEAGKFRLTDPLYEYIPEYRHMAVRHVREDGSVDLRAAQNQITIEHLFSMSAGIDMWSPEDLCTFTDDSGNEFGTLDVIRSLAAEPLLFEPGSHFKYGICHDVLGALIEVLIGKRFGEYLQENIFDRLGMRDTSFHLVDESRFCKLYNRFNGKTGTAESIGESFGFILKPTEKYESGGGGLYSTVQDYIRLAEALCHCGVAANGERILSAQTIDLMRQRRLNEESQQDFAKFGGPSKHGYSYGLGVRTLVDREANNSLSSNGEFGWDGARGCYVVIDPDGELALFYAQQEGGWPWWNWHGTVRNYAYASVWGG